MKGRQVRVSPKNGDWKVHSAGASKASAICNTKTKAVDTARAIAQNKWAEIIVQNRNGQIGFKNSYGKDFSPPRW